jgi:hypothetical protein
MALLPPFRSSSGRAARGLINAAPDQGPWVGADRPDDSDEFDYVDAASPTSRLTTNDAIFQVDRRARAGPVSMVTRILPMFGEAIAASAAQIGGLRC